jgi:hypothetical protein
MTNPTTAHVVVSTEERELKMFGQPKARVLQAYTHAIELGAPHIYVMGILSDAQEAMARDHVERARQMLNEAKMLIDTFGIFSPAPVDPGIRRAIAVSDGRHYVIWASDKKRVAGQPSNGYGTSFEAEAFGKAFCPGLLWAVERVQ